MERVAVIGPAGAGKSRLAGELGLRLGLRVVHLDELYWRPGWIATPAADWEALQRRIMRDPSWVVDAQHDDILPDWLEVADTVVLLDVSPFRCLWRAARRRRTDEPSPGVPRGSAPAPAHRALVKFARGQWNYRRRLRPDLLAKLETRRNGSRAVVLRRNADVRRFLGGVDSPVPARGSS
jgi:adenylate kinase family enzyme